MWHLKLALGQGGSFFYHFRKIRIDSHRLILDLLRHIGIALVDADVKSIPPVIGILPEIVFDDAGGVVADTEFEKYNVLSPVIFHELLIPLRRSIPPGVLHESIVGPEIHAHGSAAPRASGHQFGGHGAPDLCAFRHRQFSFLDAVPLTYYHFFHGLFVIIGPGKNLFSALKQTVIALRVEQSALIKACFLEAVIHIGGQHEIILILHQCKQPVVDKSDVLNRRNENVIFRISKMLNL